MEKQIEEMARLLCGQAKSCNECSVHKPCLMMNCARILTDKGYRRASEVAREIFAEIEETVKKAIRVCDRYAVIPMLREAKMSCYKDLLGYIEKLKKKYTEITEEGK